MTKPLYMWAGGKSKLLKHYAPILPSLQSYDFYAEPFFGGGAFYGNLVETFGGETYVGDVNDELMGLLRTVRDSLEPFIRDARAHVDVILAHGTKDARKAAYYELRKDYWSNPTADRLYALMKLGFNGIWQTNKDSHGLFATPAGLLNQSDGGKVVDETLLRSWHKVLQRTVIHSGSYETLSLPADKRGLLFLDPPYRDSFTNYSTGFNDSHQLELCLWACEQARKGHTVMLSNRHVEGERFFEDALPGARFTYFDVTYTAGRRKRVDDGFEAKPAREFLAILEPS